MFGAAGAPVTRLGDFRLDLMSTASAILSMIAPAAPATPQGSSTVDASAFEGLLASMMGGEMTTDGGDAEAAPSIEKTDATDAAMAAAVVPAQTLPPAPQPILLLGDLDLSVETALVETDEAALPVVEAPAVEAPAVETPTAPVVPATPTPATDAGTVDTPVEASPLPVAPPAAQPVHVATTPRPVDKTPTGKTADAEPLVRPAVKASVTDAPEVLPVAPTSTDAKATVETPEVLPPAPVEVRSTAEDRPTVETAERLAVDLTQARLADTAMVEVVRPLTATAEVAPAETSAPATTTAPAPAPTLAKTAAPEVLPPAPAVMEDAAAKPPVQPIVPADVQQAVAAALKPLDASAKGETPELTKYVVPPVPDAERKAEEARPQGETPSLRGLAERAARSTETNAAVDTAAPATYAPTATTPASTSTASAASASPSMAEASAPRPEIAAAAETVVEAADTTSEAPVEAPAPEAAPSAQTAGATREALPPTLSRASVEATAQIAAQILKRLDGRSTRFEMSLTPDELGRIDVKLDIDAEGRLAARLAFDNPAAAADLRGRADELRRQLEQQGFHVADDAFEFTQRDSGSSAFDRGQGSQNQERGQSRAFAAASRLNAEADTAQPPRWQALSLTPTGVDLKV
jgi:flagellar hook-length control protein FliK